MFLLVYVLILISWYVNSSSFTFRSGELLVSHSVSRHPNQPHLVAAGCDNGAVRFWDLRNEKQPLLSITTAHEEDGE